MQQEDNYSQEISKLFRNYNPPPNLYQEFTTFLTSECKPNLQNTKKLIKELLAQSPKMINFNAFCAIMRIIQRRVVAHNNQELKLSFSTFLISYAKIFFPYNNHLQNTLFQKFSKLFKNISISVPQNLNNHCEILVFVNGNSKILEWNEKLIEKINDEVFVDKKNQQAKAFKVNRHIQSFIVQNFDKFHPQLERLLIRSQSNIEVWQDFISSIDNWKGIDLYVMILLNKIKGSFQNYPEVSIKIVNTLVKSIKDEKVFKETIGFLSNLINTEHNIKKKIVYLKMLDGVIQSLSKNFDDKFANESSQQIMVAIMNSLGKVTQEDDFNVVSNIIDGILPFITEAKQDLARLGKLYIKNANKYVQILFVTIISAIYTKKDIQSYATLKEIFTHYKAQISNLLKTNWQIAIPALCFLSQSDSKFLDQLSQNLPLFKISCLSLTKFQKKTGLKLLSKYLEYIRGEQDEEISNNFYVISVLLLEDIKQKRSWTTFTSTLQQQQKINLITKGIFPLTLYPCAELKKNKGNFFNSLLLFIWNSLQNKKITLTSGQDMVRISILYSTIKPNYKNTILCQKTDQIQEKIKNYLMSNLYNNDIDFQEKEILSQLQRSQISYLSNNSIRLNQNYLIELLEQLSNEEYYKNNLTFLIDFDQDIIRHINIVKAELEGIKNDLIEKDIYKVEEIKAKKIYYSANFEVKMMSQQEVKAEKYRKHFVKMLFLFQKVTSIFLLSMKDHSVICSLWYKNLKPLLAMTKFPEHRLSIQKLVRRSCLISAFENRQSFESKIFFKYSVFLGQFFARRHSGITPSVSSMGNCDQFLKTLLSLPFQQPNQNFSLLKVDKNQFILLFINQMCQYLLQNMQFDVNLKKHAIKFYYKCFKVGINFNNEQLLYTYIANSINILTGSQFIHYLLFQLVKIVKEDRYKELFGDILNFIIPTKKLILQIFTSLNKTFKPQFQEFIKLKILALQTNQEISKLAQVILQGQKGVSRSILGFNMKKFVEKNSKETIEKLCLFIKQALTVQTCEEVFKMVIKTLQTLYDQNFNQQGLEMFPFFLTINIQYITEPLYKPIFELLITKFTAKEQFATLNKLSVEIGISIIKKYAPYHAQKLLLVLQGFINKSGGVSNIIFLGVLAPFLQGNKNLQLIEQRITQLFRSNKQADQRSISKCMPDLMSFFKKPQVIISEIFINIGSMKTQELQIGQAYLFSGLLKGIGYKQTHEYLQKILISTYLAKTKVQKCGRIHLINALIQNFGRVVELKGIRIVIMMIGYMADNAQEIRNISKKVGQSLILKMSSYSVKLLLPQLLKGLQEEQNWRVKISYIWILGIMANCSAKQLQTSLPIIVPTLSTCLSNAHPTIRQKASEALNLIGQTIKNPEISQCVNILIEALENPFQNSIRAIDILLKTNFYHFIDPPSLSMIIPILDYSMRGRISQLKAGSCQVIGSIVELIANPYDLLPYLKIVIVGLRTALCDPLPEIRSIAAMAIGKISAKIGIKESEQYFKFVLDIIQSPTSNTTERQGAAQAHAQIICNHSYEYFQESLNKIFEKLNSISHNQKEGYILVFLYVPSIKTDQFQGFIKEVNQNIYIFVSDQEENIRNSAMMVQKVLITNYCLSHTDLLLNPLCDGVFENNWKKRNAALILIGQMLNVIKSYMYNTRLSDKTYAYYRGLMAVYVMKDDQLEMPRMTANQVWNTYIENTPKTIKLGLSELVKMWTKWTHSANGVVFHNIVAFSSKYGQNYFTQILQWLEVYLKEPEHQRGVFQVLSQFIKRLNTLFLNKESYKSTIREIFTNNLFSISEKVRPFLAKTLALYIDKLHEQRYFQDLLYSTIQKMDTTQESNDQYTYNLHLLKDLLNTNSHNVVDRVINKVMQAPMSEFKIQVITNNAERLANYLYSHFKVPATEVLVDEIYLLVNNKSKENRLGLIIYCLEQVSLQLNLKNKEKFISMLNLNIHKGILNYTSNRNILEIFLNMLIFFLNSTPLSQIDDLQSIIGQMAPIIFFDDEKLKELGHKIYLLLISDNRNNRTPFYMKQMIVSFQNNIVKENHIIWNNQIIFKDYVNTLVKGMAYGKEDVMDESLDMVEFIMNHTPRKLIEKQILRIVGPIIRIANYSLFQKQKIRILHLLAFIYKQAFNTDAYNNQVLSITLRILQEFKNSEDIMNAVSDAYLYLLVSTNLKQEFILAILLKIRTFGANLVESFYFMIRSLIEKKIQLPKTLYEKIYQESMIIILNNQGRLSVKGLYYASKISALLGIFLGKSIDKVQQQLSGLTCSYENVLNYVHFAEGKKKPILKMQIIQVFIKEGNRQKVCFLLKSIKDCLKYSQQSQAIYTQEYIKKLVPENITGFDDISDIIDEFYTQKVQVQAQDEEEING